MKETWIVYEGTIYPKLSKITELEPVIFENQKMANSYRKSRGCKDLRRWSHRVSENPGVSRTCVTMEHRHAIIELF